MMVRILISALAAMAIGLSPAHAQWAAETEYSKIRVLPGASAFEPGETLWLAFEQEVRPGWHVFWVNPGDAGLPLNIEWTMPDGFSAGEILHPVPEFIPVGPLASYAHEGKPVFLIPLTAPDGLSPGEDIRIGMKASWQTCEDICVPEEATLSFALPVLPAGEATPVNESIFAGARAALPDEEAESGTIERDGDNFVLRMPAPEDFSTAGAFFFAEPEGLIEAAASQNIIAEGGQLTIELTPGWADDYDGDSLAGILAFGDGDANDGRRRGVNVSADVIGSLAPLPQAQAKSSAINLPVLIALAFFGGALLNLMPCVFPIVFIKAASLVSSASQAGLRRDGLLYTAGVVSALSLIGLLLLVLRAGGEQLGWGFHLQSPLVVGLSAYVLMLVGLNLFGLFHVGESMAGAGQSLTRKPGAAGSFFTGLLAVVVAAPCIGPLLSAPLGAAILLPGWAGFLIFVLMGLGLAAPYLALSLVPGLAKALPAPGPWMNTLKQALAFPVFGAAAYFLWVFAQQTAGTALAALLAGAVLLAFAAWLFEKSKADSPRALALRIVAAVAVVAAIAPLMRVEPAAAASAEGKFGAVSAVDYSAASLEEYRRAGVPVFVDFTAAWCVTCQFDKLTIFSSGEVAGALDQAGAVFMVADWTVRDPEITEALESFGASGVPFYVYYPASGAPVVFDIPLTKKAVLETVGG